MKTIAVLLLALLILPPVYSQDEFETATIKIGTAELVVELAQTRREREIGLMHRKKLPDGHGMLFIYPKKQIVKLWMKNTFIPLSAAFIDEDGMIFEIVRMEKLNSSKIYKSTKVASSALEVPLGYFERNGITVGDRLIIK